jgi:hypothetical protein
MRSQGEAIRERSSKARKTSGSVADGEIVWSWHPLLMSSCVETLSTQPVFDVSCNPSGDGGQRNSAPGRSRISRKTTAWGMPDVSGAFAVNTGVHTQLPPAHTGLRVHWAPGIPRALCFQRAEEFLAWLGRSAPRERECMSRHCEELLRRSNPCFEFAGRWIASLTLAMTLVQRGLRFDSLLSLGKPTKRHHEPAAAIDRQIRASPIRGILPREDSAPSLPTGRCAPFNPPWSIGQRGRFFTCSMAEPFPH